ncbi:phosphomannomutase [Haloprofundus salinisoli]|uniref:phosphomannomutase n=1 Tax=Haloprofundus salinisoli TaxID=2876193 RepID=UPI001CCBE3AE|nr:phosphomannomutase [Haloprofundus salinisoli]
MELFGTAGIRGSATERVTPELALAVGRAVGRDGAEVVVARDGRVTGPGLAAAVEAGLLSAGADVRRAGMLPTPALAFASRGRRGVILTASHNPPTDNGIKVFDSGVEYDRAAEQAVEERVAADEPSAAWDDWGDSGDETVLSAYRRAVTDYARGRGAPLSGLRVAVDCGNGMAGLATPQVLRSLGAEVITLNGNVDGHFPGRESKPTAESLRDLRRFVADAGDDGEPFAFGIGHDGDADRVVLVTPDGEVIHEDTVVAILAEHYVRSVDTDDPVVVTTPNASARIDERVREAGGRVERVRLGALHEGIAAAENAGGTVVFAAEPWKHIHTQFGGWIDGIASAAVVSRLVADVGLDALCDPVTERPYRKVSVDCPDVAKREAMATLERTLPDAFPEASVETEYGVRLEFPDSSWLLVRPSGTEPYVRLYVESDDVDSLVADAGAVVENAVETSKN